MKPQFMMKKHSSRFLVLFVLVLIAPSIQATIQAPYEPQPMTPTKPWTTLYYLDNDYTGGFNDPLDDVFLDEIASSPTINVIAIQDNLDEPAFIYYIDENHTKILLEDLGEVNMGDSLTLKNFIDYAKQEYPAERYLLWIVNHGGGWKGSCIDQTDNDNGLTMDECHSALAETGGVDIICFLACLMSNIEAVYELRDCVDVFIGSEDLAYLSWFNGVCGDTNQLLTSTPELTSEDVGTQIVNSFPKHKNPYSNKLTMSAIRTDKITALAQALDQLAAYHTSHWLRNYRSIYQAHTSTFLLADYQTWAPVFEVYDLKGYLQNLKSSPQKTAALDALNDVIIAEVHGSNMGETNGLSIFFPTRKSSYGLVDLYEDENYGLDFVADTQWNEFLYYFIATNTILRRP